MISSTPSPLDPPTAPDAPGVAPSPGENPAPTPAEPMAPTPDEPTVPLPPEPAPDPSGTSTETAIGTAEPEADNALEADVVEAVDPGGQPD